MQIRLSFKASGDRLYPDLHAMAHSNMRRYIGRTFDGSIPGFVPMTEPHEIEVQAMHLADYRQALIDGDLLPGNESTAKFAGLKFNPLA